MKSAPVAYELSFEHPEPDEADTAKQMAETLLKISETVLEDSGHASRSVHAKGHALIRGKLEILPNLPPELAQGLFATPATFETIMRVSTTPGDILDDDVSTPRGMALKILDVPGARLPGSEQDSAQDFVMVNGPAFAAPTAKAFLGNLKLLEKTTDKAEALKLALSAALRGVETVLEAVGSSSGTVKSLGGHPMTHPLGETFFSQAPVLYGRYMAKVSLVPVSANLTALKDKPIDRPGERDYIRGAVSDFCRGNEAVWELRVQLCTDLEKMPIEDSSKLWPEELSPYITVARLTTPMQDSWQGDDSIRLEDGLSFSPWHGIAAHRPLGSVMRVRKVAYEASAGFRGRHNGCPFHVTSSPTLVSGENHA